MKKRLILLLILFWSCGLTDNLKEQIAIEVENLISIDLQRDFLTTIGELDQEVRHHETRMLQQFGYRSKEHKEALRELRRIDRRNLLKVEAYLEKYGYPKINDHGERACGVPWLVIHHAPGGIKPRKRNFKYIFSAYRNGDIGDGELTFYLNRMYDKKFGKRIEWSRPFKVEEELDTLYTALNLWSIVNELDVE